MKNKKFLFIFLILVFSLILPKYALAGLSEGCFPAVKCGSVGQDYYADDCRLRIETLADCGTLPDPPNQYWGFNCDDGCYVRTTPQSNPCSGGIIINETCMTLVDVVEDTFFKIWDGSELNRLVYVTDAGCTNNQIVKWDGSAWVCSDEGGLWTASDTDIYYDGGNVGIGTDSPITPLDVNGSVRFGTRPDDPLNPEIPGTDSFASGYQTTASGYVSTAMGNDTTAVGTYSTAMGSGTTASGSFSTAMGSGTTAEGNYSTAMGSGTIASGITSTAMGNNTTASGLASTAMGNQTTASANYSTAMGFETAAYGTNSTAMGRRMVVSGSGNYSVGIGLSAATSYELSDPNTMAIMGGNVGIGTTSPNYTLDVIGTIGSDATTYHSDIRWKKNIKTVSTALDKVLKLRGVEFEWNKEKFKDMGFQEGKKIGLIAQEVESVLPETVDTANDGYKSVQYANIVAVLIEAIKEQQQMIEELKLKIETLTLSPKS